MNQASQKISPRNRSIRLEAPQRSELDALIETPHSFRAHDSRLDCLVHADFSEIADAIPKQSVHLLFLDPPYNLSKKFGEYSFKARSQTEYAEWLNQVLNTLKPVLHPTASIYICGDWRSSTAIHQVAAEHFYVLNRITFERDKGRAAMYDWKNNSEDIWFCTMGREYTFNPDAVRIKKRVIAPYKSNGKARDWQQEDNGRFRLTGSSNLWTDITIPFWSMPENTPHPTQKPEKLLARIILASSNLGDLVLDPFGGSGTTGVVARKLGRHFILSEIDREHCYYAAHRLELAKKNKRIQGYHNGVFWERNSLSDQMQLKPPAQYER